MQLTVIFCYNRPYCGPFDSFFAATKEGDEDGCASSATHEDRRKRQLDFIGRHYWLVGIFMHKRGNEMLKLCRNLYTTFSGIPEKRVKEADMVYTLLLQTLHGKPAC